MSIWLVDPLPFCKSTPQPRRSLAEIKSESEGAATSIRHAGRANMGGLTSTSYHIMRQPQSPRGPQQWPQLESDMWLLHLLYGPQACIPTNTRSPHWQRLKIATCELCIQDEESIIDELKPTLLLHMYLNAENAIYPQTAVSKI